jgi:quinoprotein glucose dehydrogenase
MVFLKKHLTLVSLSLSLVLANACNQEKEKRYEQWSEYGGTVESIRYSSLTQVDTANVSKLEVAWVYESGDTDTVTNSQIQCNPIVIDGSLYGINPRLKVFALDGATGKEKWVFNPVDSGLMEFADNNIRGVTYWTDGKENKRIFYTPGSSLICLDAITGKRVTSFGNNGRIYLHEGLGRKLNEFEVMSNTPGVVYQNLLILGTMVSERAGAAPGHIRAFDVRTGMQKWIFHTIPEPGEYGYETWDDPQAWQHIGGANNWCGMSIDKERGIVFVPTGSASYDFYGGKRKGDNLFANTLLALDAVTGKRIWHFQTVHHDLWDKDLPAPPSLVTIQKDGKKIDAVAQPTKTGMIFLFERESGKPVYPIEERPVPTETYLAGEKLSPTQPIPTHPKPFVRQVLREEDLNDIVPDSSLQEIKTRLSRYKNGDMFNAPSKEGTVIFPGYDGGVEWGGCAYDPATGILYVNANEMPWILTMVAVKKAIPQKESYFQAGKRLYTQNCMSCHGPDKKGSGNFPTLINVNQKYDFKGFHSLISTGRGRMPSFNMLDEAEKKAIATFVLQIASDYEKNYQGTVTKSDTLIDLPYIGTGYNKFLTMEGYPAVKPPWGTINAINLNSGELVWKSVLGDYPELKAKGIHSGTENYGGPVVTAGGLVFIAATRDSKIRAFNKRTGELLWEHSLPRPGFATPSVYVMNGKQYLVIACGGGKLNTKSGDKYVAFALPENK